MLSMENERLEDEELPEEKDEEDETFESGEPQLL